jgi:hypothetical protein
MLQKYHVALTAETNPRTIKTDPWRIAGAGEEWRAELASS